MGEVHVCVSLYNQTGYGHNLGCISDYNLKRIKKLGLMMLLQLGGIHVRPHAAGPYTRRMRERPMHNKDEEGGGYLAAATRFMISRAPTTRSMCT
jgi:hypothetical protein